MDFKKEFEVKLINGNRLVRNQDGIWTEILRSGIEIVMDEEEAIETLIDEVNEYVNKRHY